MESDVSVGEFLAGLHRDGGDALLAQVGQGLLDAIGRQLAGQVVISLGEDPAVGELVDALAFVQPGCMGAAGRFGLGCLLEEELSQ